MPAHLPLRTLIHLALHVLVPALVALTAGPGWRRWGRAFLLLLAGLVVDLDHLWARPVFVPGRCSIGFHPLHRPPAILAYLGLTLFRPTRWWGLGLLIHMALDALDCLWMRWEG